MNKRIAWPVDPFAEDLELQKRTTEFLRLLHAQTKAEICPISIIQWGDRTLMPGAIAGALLELEAQAKGHLEKFFKRHKLKGLVAPTILTQNDLSLQKAVQSTITAAKKLETQLMVLSSRARKGATRFLIGSFADTLILNSTLLTIVVSPKTHPLKRIRTILFPTDFRQKSKDAFTEVIQFASEMDAKILIFHRLEMVTYPHLTDHPEYENWKRAEIRRCEKEAEWLRERADESNVDTIIEIVTKGPSVAESVLSLAKKTPSSILALVSHTAPSMVPILLGSNTRQILHAAGSPTWVIHPKGSAIPKIYS